METCERCLAHVFIGLRGRWSRCQYEVLFCTLHTQKILPEVRCEEHAGTGIGSQFGQTDNVLIGTINNALQRRFSLAI